MCGLAMTLARRAGVCENTGMLGFQPQRWLRGPHAQTLSVTLPIGAPPRSFRRLAKPFVCAVEGGGWPHDPGPGSVTGTLYWQTGEGRAPLAVLVHGLGGSDESLYVVQTARALHARGYHVLALNQRGAGSSAAIAPYLYHAGLTGDVDHVVRAFAQAPGVDGVVVVGFSIGGNVALRLAGEWADAPPPGVRAVISMAAPVDLQAAARNLERWQCAMYRAHVLRGLIAQAVKYRRAHPARAPYSARKVVLCTQIREYDEQVIVPRYGFESVDDYYARASAGPLLGAIGVPTLALHATDDPMVPGAGVERALAGASAKVEVQITAHGGHLGWAEDWTGEGLAERWSTRVMLEFLERVA